MEPHHTQTPTTRPQAPQSSHAHPGSAGKGPYGRLLLMLLLSFLAMFVLMYAMVDRIGNAVPNANQAYMAALMTAPMLLLELALMRGMYPDRRRNLVLIAAGIALLLGSWFAIRAQVAVGDRQFLKSMIPHHAGAILMCQQADLRRPDVRKLCDGIVSAQEQEIALMRAMLERPR